MSIIILLNKIVKISAASLTKFCARDFFYNLRQVYFVDFTWLRLSNLAGLEAQ